MLRSRSGPIVREVARCDLPITETNKLLLVFEWRPAWATEDLIMPTPPIPDIAVFQRKLATLPLVTYQAGETVLSALDNGPAADP